MRSQATVGKHAKSLRDGIGRDWTAAFCERRSATANLLDPLDPDAVVADVQVVEDVGRLVLPEDSVNLQQASEDAGLPWAQQHKQQVCISQRIYFSPPPLAIKEDDARRESAGGRPKT